MAADMNSLSQLLGMPVWLLVILLVWTLIWKGIALWKAAQRSSVVWFVVLLVVNTAGILEILYIFVFADWKKKAVKKRVKKTAAKKVKKKAKKKK